MHMHYTIKNKTIAVMASLLICLTTTAHAEQIADCLEITPKDTKSYYKLAERYFSGHCVELNYKTSEKWYLKAAETGHGLSQLRLGLLYAENHFEGVATDYKLAEKWFIRAAEQNAGDAQFRLGNFYHHYVTPPKYDQAFTWLKKSAENEHVTAQYDVANFYKKGQGIKADEEEFIYWMESAADGGSKDAAIELARFYENEKKDPESALYWAERVTKHKTAEAYWLNKVADYYMKKWNIYEARTLYDRAVAKYDDEHAKQEIEKIFKIFPEFRDIPQK